ncbi:unnamed protein product [Eretmochelys imbricata]
MLQVTNQIAQMMEEGHGQWMRKQAWRPGHLGPFSSSAVWSNVHCELPITSCSPAPRSHHSHSCQATWAPTYNPPTVPVPLLFLQGCQCISVLACSAPSCSDPLPCTL